MRFTVEVSKRWRNTETGATASIFGSCPWYSDADKSKWVLEAVGWTLRDNIRNTVGVGRLPFPVRAEAEELATKLNEYRGESPAEF